MSEGCASCWRGAGAPTAGVPSIDCDHDGSMLLGLITSTKLRVSVHNAPTSMVAAQRRAHGAGVRRQGTAPE